MQHVHTVTATYSRSGIAHRNGNIYIPQQWQQLKMVTAAITNSRSITHDSHHGSGNIYPVTVTIAIRNSSSNTHSSGNIYTVVKLT